MINIFILVFRLIVNYVWQVNYYANSYGSKTPKYTKCYLAVCILCIVWWKQLVLDRATGWYFCLLRLLMLLSFFLFRIVVLIPTKLLLPLLLSTAFPKLLVYFCLYFNVVQSFHVLMKTLKAMYNTLCIRFSFFSSRLQYSYKCVHSYKKSPDSLKTNIVMIIIVQFVDFLTLLCRLFVAILRIFSSFNDFSLSFTLPYLLWYVGVKSFNAEFCLH